MRTLARERVALATQLSVLVGLVGLALIVIPGIDGSSSAIGLALMVGATVSWSLGSFFAHRLPLPEDGFVATTWEMLSAALFLLVLGTVTGELGDVDPGAFSLESVAAWLYLALAGTLIGFTAYAWLLRNAPISKVVTHQYVNPLVAIVLGAVLLDEQITLTTGIGAALIVGSVFVAVRQESLTAKLSSSRARRRAKHAGRPDRLTPLAVGGTAARTGSRRIRLEVVHKTRLCLDALEPGLDGRIVRELDAGVARDMGIGVEADVGDGVVGSEEEVVRARCRSRTSSECRPTFCQRSTSASCPSARPVRIQKRPVPMFGSSRFCSKKSHCAARARPSLSPGSSAVPSAR